MCYRQISQSFERFTAKTYSKIENEESFVIALVAGDPDRISASRRRDIGMVDTHVD